MDWGALESLLLHWSIPFDTQRPIRRYFGLMLPTKHRFLEVLEALLSTLFQPIREEFPPTMPSLRSWDCKA